MIKVLVATGATQGLRASDYCHTVEGELVRVGEVCRKDRDDPDGGCGCGRGFAGLSSHRATTTARVAELPMVREEYVEAIRSGMQAQGWTPCACCSVDEADDLAEYVAGWPVGAVVERRLEYLHVRCLPGETPS